MSTRAYRATRRSLLQAAAAGVVLAPLLNARPAMAAPLPPSGSIVDAHIHLWDLSTYPVPWVASDPILNQSYVLQDYKDQSAGLGVGAIVYVQAAWANEYSLLEADYVAANDPLVQGMVAYAPLEYGDQTRVYLDSLMTRGAVVKGIRRGLPDSKDTKFDMDRFIKGIQLLPEYGLSFDILGKGTPHLDMAINIAQKAPATSLIIDHLLKPNIKTHELDPWRQQMTTLASFPNVAAKISGLATEADLQNWTPEDLKPYVDHALTVFDENRVIFGGDWPPILTANSTYARWVHTLDDLTSGMGAVAKRKLFGDNARTIYRLGAG
jgi:L-fuconolactonase